MTRRLAAAWTGALLLTVLPGTASAAPGPDAGPYSDGSVESLVVLSESADGCRLRVRVTAGDAARVVVEAGLLGGSPVVSTAREVPPSGSVDLTVDLGEGCVDGTYLLSARDEYGLVLATAAVFLGEDPASPGGSNGGVRLDDQSGASCRFPVRLSSEDARLVTLTVRDVSGQVITRLTQAAGAGGEVVFDVDLGEGCGGTYLATATDERGSELATAEIYADVAEEVVSRADSGAPGPASPVGDAPPESGETALPATGSAPGTPWLGLAGLSLAVTGAGVIAQRRRVPTTAR